MTIFDDVVRLPDAFIDYIEQNYYGQVTQQSMLDVVIHDPEFLKNPLKHVALFSDHGILHGRDIAGKISHVIHHINGRLIPHRPPSQLGFMLGYGAMLAYLHDIGMKHFSAFGRAMHPEFAAQLVFTPEFDPWIELLWHENSGNVAWRLINLATQGVLEHPKRVLRELLALSMAHSKSKVPIEVLNDVHRLQHTMQRCVSTELTYLYYQQQVERAEAKLARHDPQTPSEPLTQHLAQANVELAQFRATMSVGQGQNPDIQRLYEPGESPAFSWLLSDVSEVQQLTLDVIDTVRALRCADALRQRGTAFTTSAGYEVLISQDTANAIYVLRSTDQTRIFFVEGKDPISAGEANMANSTLDQDGNLRLALRRGAFSSPEATQWAAYSAAFVIQDIQADVIGSFCRPPSETPETLTKPQHEMKILVEGVDDNPEFADLICQTLRQIAPDLAPRIKAVTSLQHANLAEIERYLGGKHPDWGITEKLHLLDQLAKTGQKVDPIDLDQAFDETRLITVQPGEVLIEQGTVSGFAYIPFQAGLKRLRAIAHPVVLPWMPVGAVELIQNAVAPATVVAEQPVELLMIPKQIFLRYWYAPYPVEEFTQLFDSGDGPRHLPRLPTKRTTSLEMTAQRLTRRKRTLPIAMHLMSLFPQTEQLEIVMGLLDEIQISQGAYLFRRGDRPDALYIVELGQISTVDDQSPQQILIQTFESGDWLGGQEVYSQAVHRYSAIANQPSTLYRLSTSALAQLQTESPLIAHTLAHHLLTLLARQLSQAREEITTLIQGRTEMLDRLTASPSE